MLKVHIVKGYEHDRHRQGHAPRVKAVHDKFEFLSTPVNRSGFCVSSANKTKKTCSHLNKQEMVEGRVEKELYGPAVSALHRANVEVKQRWSVMRWVTENLLFRAPPRFGRHVKPLVPAAYTVVSTHQSALGPRGGLWPVLLMCSP
jgi:hypothetical protein